VRISDSFQQFGVQDRSHENKPGDTILCNSNTYGYDNISTSISLRGKGFRLSRAQRLYSLFVCCAIRILNDLILSEEWPIDIQEANMDEWNEKCRANGPKV
jgi:hypothetical protein